MWKALPGAPLFASRAARRARDSTYDGAIRRIGRDKVGRKCRLYQDLGHH